MLQAQHGRRRDSRDGGKVTGRRVNAGKEGEHRCAPQDLGAASTPSRGIREAPRLCRVRSSCEQFGHSLSLGLHICKMGTTTLPSLWGDCNGEVTQSVALGTEPGASTH